MLIDCDRCEVRGQACGDCVVTVLLGSVPRTADGIDLDADQQAAIGVLASSGMVPPLRLALPPERDAGRDIDSDIDNDGDDAAPRQRAAG
jgi:hypothetical protein